MVLLGGASKSSCPSDGAVFSVRWFVYGNQRVHVGIWYILIVQRGSHFYLTLSPKYAPCSYMDPLGLVPETCKKRRIRLTLDWASGKLKLDLKVLRILCPHMSPIHIDLST